MKFERRNPFHRKIKSIGFAVKRRNKINYYRTQRNGAIIISGTNDICWFLCRYNCFEWMMQILVFGLVLGIEGLNTAVEK